MEGVLHFGLDIAETKAVLNETNIALLMQWARNGIANFDIEIGTKNWEALIDAPEMFEVTDADEQMEYYRFILRECMGETCGENV